MACVIYSVDYKQIRSWYHTKTVTQKLGLLDEENQLINNKPISKSILNYHGTFQEFETKAISL
jgi:hypothetical protein